MFLFVRLVADEAIKRYLNSSFLFLFLFYLLQYLLHTETHTVAMRCLSFSTQKPNKVQVSRTRILEEKRARLYIIRRCVLMLLCWRDHEDKWSFLMDMQYGEHIAKSVSMKIRFYEKQGNSRHWAANNPKSAHLCMSRRFH